MKKSIFAGLVIVMSAFVCDARVQGRDDMSFVRETAEKFFSQRAVYPQEKVYVHTDRDHYLSGDTMWLRSYVVCAADHKLAAFSRFVYVDLVDPAGRVAHNIRLIMRGGVFSGFIPLHEETASGTYTLRAYTNFMRNFDQEYYSVKRIRVSDRRMLLIPMSMEFDHRRGGRVRAALTIQDLREGRSLNGKDLYLAVNGEYIDIRELGRRGELGFTVRLDNPEARNVVTVEYEKFQRFFTIPAADDEFDVSFFPEGGSLIDGAGCIVGFKAMGKDGMSRDITGRIVDDEGYEITTFGTLYKGMGVFGIMPHKGRKYYAECTGPDGETVLRFELPEARANTVALKLRQTGGHISVGISCPDNFRPAGPFYLLMHMRGNLVLAHRIEDIGRPLRVETSGFPSGVLHVVLTDGNMNVLSERLTFILNDDQAYAVITTDRESYGRREAVDVTATITDAQGQPLRGSFSVSVTDDKLSESDSASDIFTEFLLASDLRGHIEDPAWYFCGDGDDHRDRREALEALMLTQGWRRYDVPNVLKGRAEHPQVIPESIDAITGGVVTIPFRGRPSPVRDATVTAFNRSTDLFQFDAQSVDNDGKFAFHGFDIPEGTSLFVRANSARRRNRVELLIDRMPQLPVIPQLLMHDAITRNDPAQQTDTAYLRRVSSTLRQWRLDDVIEIDEVVVMAKAPPRGFYANDFRMGRSFDKKHIDALGMPDMRMLLIRLLPMLLEGPEPDTLTYLNQPVRLIIDDWDVESWQIGFFMSVSTEIVEYLQIARDRETMPFGWNFEEGGPLYGAVISVYTKSGLGLRGIPRPVFNRKTINPLGYQRAAEFYSPKYETDAEKAAWRNDRRITLYWNPAVRSDEDGCADFRFYSADLPDTSYSIILEGVTDDGRVVRSVGSVKVK
ncbi:MAG: hypothetical protein FWE10_02170 [Rikenellaceae bacterium]|nr:hypothetical protein [Rikenellaceae bacterium]MCL2692020.1 hypothetical protein [Rikenellaceae bacterium]